MKILSLFVAVLAFAFFLPVFGVLFGALSGWIVGFFFEETILSFLGRIGVNVAGLHLWEVGAAMGFLGGFLRTTINNRKEE